MLGVNRTINNFKVNYSQARSRAALAKGETTWQCPNNPGGYLYRSPDGSVGPLAEFEDQFKGSMYKFYEDDKKVNGYNREIHDLISRGRKYGYMVSLSEEATKSDLGNQSSFTPERVDRIPAELLKAGLESGVFVIKDQENHTVDIPAAPDCKSNAEYIHFDRQRQMARTADLLCGRSHRLAKNPISKNRNNKNHARLRKDVDFIENGMNPDIVHFNEKYGTNIDAGLHDYEKLKGNHINVNGQQLINEAFTKEDEAFALFKAIEHFSAPDREELSEYFDEMRQSALTDKKRELKQKNRPLADKPVEIRQEEKIQDKEDKNQEKKDEQVKAASWDALIQKVCQFFIDYTRDPAETLNRFMAEYSDALRNIKNDETNYYHKEFHELLNSSKKPISRHITDELANERPSKEYITLDKYLKAKNNHIETYQSFLSDENNADIKITDTNGRELNVKNVTDMNKIEMEALVDLIDSGKINMSVEGGVLERLTDDAYMSMHCDRDLIHHFERQNMQLLKEELNKFRSMDNKHRKEYIEKHGFDPDAARDAYHYSYHKVHAMEHGQDMTNSAMDQLGISVEVSTEKEETILDKRINAYIASQALHYEHYNHEFDKAVASGKPVTVYNYKNKNMNPVKIRELGELSPTDRMALADLIDHDRIFMYAGDKKIEPVLDKYTNPDNYKQGREFYSPGISETEFKAMAELRRVRDINDKMSSLDSVPENDVLRKELESERIYRKSIADHLNSEDAKSTDTYLVSAKYLGLTKKINNTSNISEYYKRDNVDIQKMVSDQIKASADQNIHQPESDRSHNHSTADFVSVPGRFENEALKILSEGQFNREDLPGEDYSPCFH